MAGKYDEDMYENPFFLKILSAHPVYLERAVECKGTLCVPKYSIASSWSPSQEDIEDHVLLPARDDDDDYMTVSGKIVCISDDKLVTKEGFSVSRHVPVLFAETFHTDSGGSYRVFCIGGFLNRAVDKSEAGSPMKIISPTSYRQCLELLWSHPGGHKMKETLDKVLNTFAVTYDRLEGETLRSIVDAANTHFTKAMQLLLKDSVVRRSIHHNSYYMDNLKVAVETYMMNSVHKRLFRVITATMAGQDSEINKINRNLFHLQLSDLGVCKIFSQNILPAKKELNLLNRYSTPMGRLFCLKRVVGALTRPPKSSSKESGKGTVPMMTTDDLLPILIFLIVKSEIPNWMANLVYMRHFHFAKSSDDDEFGFYLASLEAALEYIRSGNIRDEIKPWKRERWNTLLTTNSPEETSPNSQSPTRQLSHSALDDFFRFVQDGDEEKVQQMLERPYRTSEEVHLKLCHPLCSCDKCGRLLSEFRSNSDLVTAYTRDNRGYTALHIAAYNGQGLLIDLLIQSNAVVDATDYLGLTPLHLACQCGFQNVMLLLLHFGADVTATDNEGNTPLHMCCANGHEDCVKALVFYEASMKRLQINVGNEFGDTPLHLAAKWGYEKIVGTLLENGADATLCNRKKQTPVSLAQNVKVQRCLQLAAEEAYKYQPQQFWSPTSSVKSRASSDSSISSQNCYPARQLKKPDPQEPETNWFLVETASLEEAIENEMKRKQEKLFKAIVEGDIQLVKFYLGIQQGDDDEDDEDEENEDEPLTFATSPGNMCHPLCQCERCHGVHKVSRRSEASLNMNCRTSTGYCPIHMAVLHNTSDIVALLIAHGADVNVQNHKQLSPLHLACCTRHSLITDLLVKAGAKLGAHDMNGDTPLLLAASNGFINGVQILIKAGADVNETNQKGNTALHEAVKRDNSDVVAILLESGADPRIKNKQEKLPLDECDDLAIQTSLIAASQRLEDSESKVNNFGSLIHSQDLKGNGGQVSIKELFAAFEEKDLHTLQTLTQAVRLFNRKSSLKKTRTRDMSAPFLDVLAQKHQIHTFDRRTLRKTQSVIKNDPLHLYTVARSCSLDVLTSPTGWPQDMHSSFDAQFIPMGNNLLSPLPGQDEPYLIPFPLPGLPGIHDALLFSSLSESEKPLANPTPDNSSPSASLEYPVSPGYGEASHDLSLQEQSEDVNSLPSLEPLPVNVNNLTVLEPMPSEVNILPALEPLIADVNSFLVDVNSLPADVNCFPADVNCFPADVNILPVLEHLPADSESRPFVHMDSDQESSLNQDSPSLKIENSISNFPFCRSQTSEIRYCKDENFTSSNLNSGTNGCDEDSQ